MTNRARTVAVAAVLGLGVLAGAGVTFRAQAQAAPAGVGHWFRGSSAPVKVTKVGIPLQVIASFAVPAGSWALSGTATVHVSDTVAGTVVHKASVSCSFADGADGFTISSPSPSGTFGYSTGMIARASFGAALSFSSPLTVTLACNKSDAGGDVMLETVQLVAVPLGSVIRH